MLDKTILKEVYLLLKTREIHPSGRFDNGGRWHAEHAELVSVRTPSRAYPYSEMTHCRTLKYVRNVAEHFEVTSRDELLKLV
mgnify:FL=1